jgi:hypothetical protein
VAATRAAAEAVKHRVDFDAQPITRPQSDAVAADEPSGGRPYGGGHHASVWRGHDSRAPSRGPRRPSGLARRGWSADRRRAWSTVPAVSPLGAPARGRGARRGGRGRQREGPRTPCPQRRARTRSRTLATRPQPRGRGRWASRRTGI